MGMHIEEFDATNTVIDWEPPLTEYDGDCYAPAFYIERGEAESALVEFKAQGKPSDAQVSAAISTGAPNPHVCDEPEWETEYLVTDRNGDMWALTTSRSEADHYFAQESSGLIEQRKVSPWLPVEQEND